MRSYSSFLALVWLLFTAAATFLLMFPPLAQADAFWQVSTGDWSDAANWNGGLPSSNVTAHITNGGSVTVTKIGEACEYLYLGPGTLNQSGGSLSWGGLLVDSNGPLDVNITGGTFSGALAYYSGRINQSGGNCIFMPSAPGTAGLWIGGGRGPASYTITKGTLNANEILVGATGGGDGTMTISDSNGNASTIVSVIGSSGADIGGGSNGGLNISSGTFQVLAGPITVGGSGNGTVNQTGGLVTCGGLVFGRSSNGGGTYNLDGGTFVVPSIVVAPIGFETAVFNFNGGTLKAAATFSTTLPIGLNAMNGNATVDTDINTVTFLGSLTGPGNLIKAGSGTLILAAGNAYTGPTSVNAGRLQVDGSLASAGAVSVANGGTLSGTGSVGRVTVTAGGRVAPGDGSGSVGTITLNGNLVINSGAESDFDLASTSASDLISMPTSTLILNGQQFSDFSFSAGNGFGPGVYTLVDAKSIQGNLGANLTGTVGGLEASLSINSGNLQLTVVPEPSILALFGAGAIGLLVYSWWRWATAHL